MHKAFYIGYNGKKEAYIYIWFSKKYKLVYVGETNDTNGVLGRAIQHVSGGTLYKKVYEKGYDLYNIDDFILLSFPLPRDEKFRLDESSYRNSVEFLVQKKLYEMGSKVQKPYSIISTVRLGAYIDYKIIKSIAEKIADDFIKIYEET